MHAPSLLMSLSIVSALGLVACGGSGSGSGDPLVGTWVLNVAKSTYVPAPGPKSQIVVISGTDQARKLVVDVTPDAVRRCTGKWRAPPTRTCRSPA